MTEGDWIDLVLFSAILGTWYFISLMTVRLKSLEMKLNESSIKSVPIPKSPFH